MPESYFTAVRKASDSFCSFSLIVFPSALLTSIDLPSAAGLWISPLPILFGASGQKKIQAILPRFFHLFKLITCYQCIHVFTFLD
jgi:hypothetical protein